VASKVDSLLTRRCPAEPGSAWDCKRCANIGLRRDVTVFRLEAARAGDSGLEPAFRRNTAERVYLFEAAHNPEVAGSNPAPLLQEVRKCSPFVSGSRAANATAHLRGPRSRSR